MRYWHCFELHGLVCSEFFLDTNDTINWKKWLNHPEQRQHEQILNTGISLRVWTRLGSQGLFLWTLPRKGEIWMMILNNVNLVCAEKMRNVSFFNILVCLLLRYDYSLSIWLSVICNIPNNELEIYNIESYSSILVFCCKTVIYVSSNVFAFILVSCWKFYRWQM